MTEFSDLFIDKVRSSGLSFRERLEAADLELDGLGDRVSKNFMERKVSSLEPESVAAVDAGRNQVGLRGGLKMLVTQALAVNTSGEDGRSLGVDMVRGSSDAYRDLRSATWQIREVEALIDAAENLEEGYLLVDGSLLTRLRVVPETLRVSHGKARNLELIQKVDELLQHVEEKELKLVGVSKDSETGVFARQIIESALETSKGEEVDLSEVRLGSGKDVEEFAEKHSLEKQLDLLRLYSSSFTDNMVLRRLTESEGHTRPVRIGMINLKFRKESEKLKRKGAKRFAEEELAGAFGEIGLNTVTEALSSLLDFPSVRTVHWRPENGAQPLRLDLLDYSENLVDKKGVDFVDGFDEELLQVMKAGYGGRSMHNVWISRADGSANLPNSEMENVYLPLLSKVLETDLQQYMRRRDRRA